jgi:3-methyl-2-oxobutanoate hydroxymethyltransferase
VGDTAAQVILGHDSTLPASMAFMLEITAAVRRGAPEAFVMADMPFGSYQCGDDEAVRNASSFLSQGGADAVKLEVDATFAPLVARLAHAGVPVVAHLGSRPQMVRAQGGYQSAGRSPAEAAVLVEAAERLIHAGAAMLLLEAVPDEVAQKVVHAATASPLPAPGRPWPVPVVGCGGGPACHGHVVVLQDLLGLSAWQPPFAPPMADLGARIQAAAASWNELIQSGRYLRDNHPYKMQG